MNELLPDEGLRHAVAHVGRAVEAAGALVIFSGALLAFVRFAVAVLRGPASGQIGLALSRASSTARPGG